MGNKTWLHPGPLKSVADMNGGKKHQRRNIVVLILNVTGSIDFTGVPHTHPWLNIKRLIPSKPAITGNNFFNTFGNLIDAGLYTIIFPDFV